MPRPITTLLVLSLVCALGAGVAAADVKQGDRAPELDGAKDERGKAFKLKALRGQWVVVTFGGSWCKPCKKELPAWDKLAAKWAGKVTFVAVNLDNDRAKGKKFMDGLKVKKMLRAYAPEDSTSAADIWSPPSQPSSYVIDPKGIVRSVHAGFVGGDEAKMDKLLGSLVK
ncbi:MAG TPA: TlpA disulfide reductase family protein [Kofleriaceae bacterium]|jgi:thiol-disulfide isomerase/thioredoxin|nr:TlpA disulfide reductase family protein [Kofleriaceae bacterium]